MSIEQSIDSFIDEFSAILKKNNESIDDQTIFLSSTNFERLIEVNLVSKVKHRKKFVYGVYKGKYKISSRSI